VLDRWGSIPRRFTGRGCAHSLRTVENTDWICRMKEIRDIQRRNYVCGVAPSADLTDLLAFLKNYGFTDIVRRNRESSPNSWRAV
jgi:hypothetical protein